jgi:predicted extracellular nuclease
VKRVLSRLGVGLVLVVAAAVWSGSALAAGNVVISQVYGGGGNAGATYTNDFIELTNRTGADIDLSTWSVQYAATTGTNWSRTNLVGSIPAGGTYLIQEGAGTGGTTPLPSPRVSGNILMAAGAGKVVLMASQVTLAAGTVCPTGVAVDIVGYGSGTNCFEGGPTPTLTNTTAAIRKANGMQDTDSNVADFTVGAPTPHGPASDTAPSVSSTSPADGASGVAADANVTVTFSEAVAVTSTWLSIVCPSGTHTGTTSAGLNSYTLDPAVNFTPGESCTATVRASQVTDSDGIDPPDTMSADYVFGFTIAAPVVTVIPIHEVQGTGDVSPKLNETVTVEGVVVGDYQLSSQFSGFYVQEEDADVDADPATSEGVFVFGGSTAVNPGDIVRVTGKVTEFNGLTEIGSSPTVSVRATGASVTPTQVSLPVANLSDLERYEGMQVAFAQRLTVTEVFNLARFGEVSLSGAGRLSTPTAVATPGAAANAVEEQNNRSRIVLDDANGQQNIDPTLYPQGGLSADNTLRVGDSLAGLVGVLDFRFALYRIQPIGPVAFDHTNPRPAAPDPVGGNMRVASFNVLNYFNGDGLGGGFPTARGANTLTEFQRQRAKEISALSTMNADVVGLMEMENDSGEHSAVADLTSGLNDAMGAGTYAYVDTGVIGTDAIKVALIYKPASVTPVGDWKIITSAVDPRFDETKSRPSLAQTFQDNATGRKFTVVVNHLKSKSSACAGDPDTGDGSGDCNLTRTRAAAALVDWLKTDPTGSGDPDYLLIGDMNAYTFESPIQTFVDGGLTNLVRKYGGMTDYSYVFDGESGYLDHALSTPSLEAQVTGVGHWHINPDEPGALDYNVEFKSANQVNTFYSPGPYRASDHDPVLIGIQLADAPTASAGGPYTVAEGGSTTLTGSGSGDGLTYAWDLDGDGTYETPGQSVTFSAAGLDGPATREVALKVSDGELSDVAKATVTITNVAPTAAIGGAPAESPEGSAIALTATSTDPGPDTVAYAWSVTKNGAAYATGTGASFSYTPDDNGTYAVTLTATDDDGGSGTAGATTAVKNVAPTATFTVTPSVFAGSPIALALTGPSDPSSADTSAGFAYAFDCGSGVFTPSATAATTCPTTDTGTPTVRGRITDKDGGSTVYTQTVSVVVTAASLCDLTTAYVTKDGVAHSLCVKLEHGSYRAYANEVAAQAGKSLTPEQAETLTRLVNRL